MSSTIIVTIISLSLLAAIAAVILYFIAQKFHVEEDPRIDEVQEMLPAANCGGCGFAGCRNFAEALVVAETFDGLNCPVAGNEVMKSIADMLGRTAAEAEPLVAVLLCNGTPEFRPRTTHYDGVEDCQIQHNLYLGETGCAYGCLGDGDCVKACKFDAIKMDEVTKLPVVLEDKCLACKACVTACPRNLIELRKKAKKDRKLYVACSNCDKGAIAVKACKVACIACNKCLKVCEFGAITIENKLAYIDANKCTFCRKCVPECSTNSILEINFPPRKPKVETETLTVENT
jgi:Na+-translocating ferredoxin:NAD+ oxidoreductase RNF subunit RnfB